MLQLVGSDSCVLRIGVLGINHKTAALALREAISRGAEALSGEKGIFFAYPTVLLSTCNRTEIYFSGEDLPSIHSDLLKLLRIQLDEPFEPHLYTYFGIDCFAHLCRVSSGLDSAIIAETEIQRQVKVAYTQSASLSRLPSCLHFAFQKALKVGKSVRSAFPLARGVTTLQGTIWKIAEEFWGKGQLANKPILLVGYSEINRGLATFFIQKGLWVTICTKDASTVSHPPCEIVDRSILRQWARFPIVICASKAGCYLIEEPSLSPRLLFDLSVPRNVDPRIGGSSQLYNIEQIDQIIQETRSQQSSHCGESERFVNDYAIKLARIYRDKSGYVSLTRSLCLS